MARKACIVEYVLVNQNCLLFYIEITMQQQLLNTKYALFAQKD